MKLATDWLLTNSLQFFRRTTACFKGLKSKALVSLKQRKPLPVLCLVAVVALGGCGGGGAQAPAGTTVGGGAIKGPLNCRAQGSVIATGSGGKTTTGSTPSVGSYTVGMTGLTYPVTITASGCMDTVTNATQSIDLSSIVMDPTQTVINLTSISTLAVATAKAAKTGGGAITQADLDTAVATVLNTFGLSASLAKPITGVYKTVTEVTALAVGSEAVSEVIKRLATATPGGASTANIVASLAADLADGALNGVAPAGVSIPVAVATAGGVNGNMIAAVFDEVAAGNLMIKQVDPLTGTVIKTLPSTAFTNAVAAMATAVSGAVVTAASIKPGATPAAVNARPQSRPVIALTGANPLTVAQGSAFTDPGSTVTDNVDTGLTATVTGTVNTATVGAYTLTYNVSDAAGNAAIVVTRTVNVTDQTAPVITLTGANPVTVAQGSAYVDAGSSVTDNVDTGLTAIVTGTVNTATVGAYTLTYNVSDAAGNAATAVTRTVNVTDQTAPVIALNGVSPVTVEAGSVYTDLFATVTDNVDATNAALTGVSTVNAAVPGNYTVTYNYTDAATNAAVAVVRTVNVVDTTAPVIALTGANPVTVAQGSAYVDAGSSVTDNVDTGLTATVTGTVNTATVGAYTLTYNVSDAAGNAAIVVTRTVNVTDQTAPVITLTGANPVTVAQGSAYVDAGSSVTDNVDTGLTATVTGTVNTATVGAYTLTYNVSDAAGNAATAVTRTVNVTDQTAPVIALNGVSPVTVEAGSVYTDLFATVTDNVDATNAALAGVSTVNAAVPGNYTVTYNYTDAATNAAVAVVRTVNVVDTTVPVIALNGVSPVTVEAGTTYTDAKATVTDNVDATNAALAGVSTVNAAVPGNYTVTYNYTDAANNVAVAVVRTVNVVDTTAPVITLTGANPVTVAQGSAYVDAGSSVTDNVDTGLTATVTGTVNTATVGIYTLTYNVSDTAGNAATAVTRTVNVAVPPTLSIAPVSVLEGSTLGTTNMVFTVTLSATLASAVTVDYTTSDGTALSASDYTSSVGTTLTIAAGATTGTITVLVGADTTFESNETLTLTLSNPTGATLGTAVATGMILNDDAGLNDTGITKWGNATANNLTVTQAAFPSQDADFGRDANPATNSNADGKAGFSFTKLDAAGQALVNQAAVYGTTPWDCVQDNVTGMMWEVKTITASSLRNKSNRYTWYNSTGVNDGGNAGTAAGTPACATGGTCDTEKYVAAVNALTGANRLCGFTDWRLPKVGELYSIVDQSIASPGPTIDTGYFPNTIGNAYWSASPYAGGATSAWIVTFYFGFDGAYVKSNNSYIRLVRGGQ